MLVVTGMSGAGRSTVGNALEDLGWYVVDNLPPQMLRPMVDLSEHSGDAIPKVAAIVDVRGGKLFADVQAALRVAARQRQRARALPRRDRRGAGAPIRAGAPSASAPGRRHAARRHHRRAHPDGRTAVAERSRHRHLRPQHPPAGDRGRRAVLGGWRRDPGHRAELRLQVRAALGCRSWSPTRASCRTRSGCPSCATRAVSTNRCATTCSSAEGALEFVDTYAAALAPVLAGYRRENKRHATIAVGCTGGKHRSVAIAEELGRRLRELPGVTVNVRHRDLGRE